MDDELSRMNEKLLQNVSFKTTFSFEVSLHGQTDTDIWVLSFAQSRELRIKLSVFVCVRQNCGVYCIESNRVGNFKKTG